MANQYVNKVVYGNKVLIDLGSDTIEKSKLLAGYTAHDKTGAIIEGTCTFDADTSEDTAQRSEILQGKTVHARGTLLEGTMPNRGSLIKVIESVDTPISIPNGYHDGGGYVSISGADKNKLIAENIRENVTILGVTGTMSGSEGVKAESKTITPSASQQTILPNADSGYNYISQVVVKAIPYSEQDNSAGGKTVTIG